MQYFLKNRVIKKKNQKKCLFKIVVRRINDNIVLFGFPKSLNQWSQHSICTLQESLRWLL